MNIAGDRHNRRNLAVAALLAALSGAAAATDLARPGPSGYASLAAAGALYELADPLPVSSLRWAPLTSPRLELAAGLLPRHEIRLAAGLPLRDATLAAGLDSASFAAPGWSFEALRATYRYTLFAQRDWSWKLGVTARVGDGGAEFPRGRFASRPLLHLAAEGRPARNWRVDFDADRLFTARGRALDIGVRVNYLLTPSFSLYGGYRYSEQGLEGEDNGPAWTNNAAVGLRYRF